MALTDATRDKIADELQQMVKGLEATFGVKWTLSLVKLSALYNDPDFTNYVAKLLKADLDDVKG